MDKNSLLSSKYPAIAVILIVSFGVYFNALFNGFVYDDLNYISENPWIKDIRHLPEIFTSSAWAFKDVSNYYRPLVNSIYMLDFHIFGLAPWGFHLTNVILHAGVSVLVFLLTALLIGRSQFPTDTNNLTLPFIAAILFAVHPIHTEAVAWVSGVQDVSFSFFYLLSFYLYVRANVMGRGISVSSLMFFFLAALSKETALTLPILLFVFDYSFKRDSISHLTSNTLYLLLKRYLPYLIVAVIYFIMRTYAIGGFSPISTYAKLSVWGYFINVFPLFIQYLGKLILPINLNAAYVFHPIHSLLEWEGIMAFVLTLCFIVSLYLVKNHNRVVFFSLLWIAIPLLPAFYILALGLSPFAERYLYLPSVGFVIIVSLGLCGIANLDGLRNRAMPFMLSIVLVITALYSASTIKRNTVWKDNITLWSETGP
jgi:hypothetical protein